ncbi:uncharacterized protein V1516DRAFT_620838 [Lipomyces oligophaga]|uniref:uncharacterized protein n=1 Tax=Lipomyces oligophaga TaxID=45792 RepID=UPI0034CD2608
MFGAICAGRQVQTNLQQLDQSKFVFMVEDGASINYIVVFLLPGKLTNVAELDPAMAASVYFQWPGKPFQLLGAISNTKPSAIFRVNQRQNNQYARLSSPDDMIDDGPGQGSEPVTISLGISIEPADQVAAQLSALHNGVDVTNSSNSSTAIVSKSKPPVDPSSTAALANKIMSNAFNFLSGFATDEGMVSLKAFNDWWQKFQNKLSVDPQFLQRLEEN